MYKPAPLRLSLSVLLAITMNLPVLAQAQQASGATAASTTASARTSASAQPPLKSPEEANRRMLTWLERKEKSANDWLSKRDDKAGHTPNWADFMVYKNDLKLSPMTESEARIAANTKALYDLYFPPEDHSSYVGTFIESGNPHVDTARGPYQWDSQKVAGLDEPGVFEAAVKNVIDAGIKSIRLGPNLFEIKNGMQSWEKFSNRVETIWEHGGTPTISVAFFPSLERWKVRDAHGKVDQSKSFLLNPQWPADMGKMAGDMMDVLIAKAAMYERHTGKKARFVINPINEPETLAGFNRQFWHGAYANWTSPLMMKYYVPSVINIGKANVAIRQAIEAKSLGERILFMHNEAMTPIYYPSHKGPGRFAVSKFMLGDDSVLKTDFDAYLKMPLEDLQRRLAAGAKAKTLNEINWAFNEYVFGKFNTTQSQREEARRQLVQQFNELKAAHLNFQAKTGKTMKTDNMLLMDYYYQTEFILNRTVPTLNAQVSANNGALLKKVLDVKEDLTLARMMRVAALEAKKADPTLQIQDMELISGLFEGVDLSKNLLVDEKTGKALEIEDVVNSMPDLDVTKMDLQKLLAAEDYFLFYSLIGIRNGYTMATDPVTTARRAMFPMFKSELKRTDSLLASLLANNAANLRKVLNVQSDPQLMQVLAQAAADTSDKRPAVILTGQETLREILNKDERRVLERLFGLTREQNLGFEPQHYARHVRLGIRDGFYKFSVEYVNALRLHAVGVGESGTPFYVFAPMLHDQVMMDYAHLLKSGAYGTQYAFGPAVDTKGWAKGPLSLHYLDDHEVNPSGMFSLVKGKRGSEVVQRKFDQKAENGWAKSFLNDFFRNIDGN
jgi:hypothetical protein